MALSNWDTLAIDHEGNSCDGVFESPSGVSVEVYKNWLCLKDSAWDKSIAMTVDSGEFEYKDLNLRAYRGPQNGVYFCVYTGYYKEDKYYLTGMLGMGVYGYEDEEWVGVKKESVDWFGQLMNKIEEDQLGDGVSFIHHIINIPDELRKLDLSSATRFNQGDRYFNKRAGLPLNETKIGESSKPHLVQLCEWVNEKD